MTSAHDCTLLDTIASYGLLLQDRALTEILGFDEISYSTLHYSTTISPQGRVWVGMSQDQKPTMSLQRLRRYLGTVLLAALLLQDRESTMQLYRL